MSEYSTDGCIELSRNAILDEHTDTVVLQLDRFHISFTIDEFFEFFDRIDDIRKDLISVPGYVVGKYIVDGEEKITLVRKPDDDEEYM